MNALLVAKELGQRFWLDNLSRTLLREGELLRLIRQDGIAGITSNPSIFQKAFEAGAYYRDDIVALQASDLSPEARFEQLAVVDIREACDLFADQRAPERPLDGWVSLEVSPALAHDADGTIAAARRLWSAVDRPNLMIKIPATRAGLVAIREVIGDGINVNVTLLFSQTHVRDVREAYIDGLKLRAERGGELAGVRSVASLFLSRIDTLVDKRLAALGGNEDLLGQAAVANARIAYADQTQRYAADDWKELERLGAKPQYLLWASTGTKNPAYPDTLYVDRLIGPDTVNTLPDATLDAFRDHGTARPALLEDVDGARETLRRLAALGVDLDAIGETLQEDGLKLFAEAFDKLLAQVA